MNAEEIKGRASQLIARAIKRAAPPQETHLSPLSLMLLGALATTTLAAGLFALYALLGPDGSDKVPAAPDWTPQTLAIVELDPPKPASADVEALSRPIFSKSRRPSPKAAKTPDVANIVETAAAPTGLTVSAIVKRKIASQAFVVSMDTPEGAWRKVGDTIDSWTVTSIEPDRVILKNGGRTTKLQLYADPLVSDSGNGP